MLCICLRYFSTDTGYCCFSYWVPYQQKSWMRGCCSCYCWCYLFCIVSCNLQQFVLMLCLCFSCWWKCWPCCWFLLLMRCCGCCWRWLRAGAESRGWHFDCCCYYLLLPFTLRSDYAFAADADGNNTAACECCWWFWLLLMMLEMLRWCIWSDLAKINCMRWLKFIKYLSEKIICLLQQLERVRF